MRSRPAAGVVRATRGKAPGDVPAERAAKGGVNRRADGINHLLVEERIGGGRVASVAQQRRAFVQVHPTPMRPLRAVEVIDFKDTARPAPARAARREH